MKGKLTSENSGTGITTDTVTAIHDPPTEYCSTPVFFIWSNVKHRNTGL